MSDPQRYYVKAEMFKHSDGDFVYAAVYSRDMAELRAEVCELLRHVVHADCCSSMLAGKSVSRSLATDACICWARKYVQRVLSAALKPEAKDGGSDG